MKKKIVSYYVQLCLSTYPPANPKLINAIKHLKKLIKRSSSYILIMYFIKILQFYSTLIDSKILCKYCSLKKRQMWKRSIYYTLCDPEAQILTITKLKSIPVQVPDFWVLIFADY